MNRIWGRHLASLVFVGLAACAFAPGCAKNDESIFIRGFLAPSQNRQGGFCSYTNDPTQNYLFSSLFDVGARDNYVGVMLVANQMIPRGDPLAPRAESNRLHINGAVVHVTFPDGTEVAPAFTSFSSGVVDPQNNGNPGFESAGIAIIDGNTAKALRDQIPLDRKTIKEVLVNIRVFGKTLGGVDVESGEYQQPMRVCNGCLVVFPEAARDPTSPIQPNCLKPFDANAAGAGGANTIPCFSGQDEATSCQFCQGHDACNPTK